MMQRRHNKLNTINKYENFLSERNFSSRNIKSANDACRYFMIAQLVLLSS
jgi:hypothetical protein